MIMSITIGGHDGTAAPATSAAGLRQAWMPQEQGTPSGVGTVDVTSVPELGGAERLGILPAETSPAVAPAGITLTMPAEVGPAVAPVETILTMPPAEVSPAVALIGPSPAVAPAGTTLTMPAAEAAPEPPRTAGQPGTSAADEPGASAAGTRPDPVAWLIALATFAAYATLSVARYLRLNPGSWD